MDEEEKSTGDEAIIKQAKKRFETCREYESEARKRFVQDLKFDAGDSDNNFQWPSKIMGTRNAQAKPSLTINQTHQHNLQIINDGKQNRPSVKIRPTGDGATYDSAQVYDGVVRRIEYQSNAQSAYDTAYSFAVRGGIGYWRVTADYVNDDSFDQDIFIRRIKDYNSVYLDPDINEVDGSDARYGFIFEDVPKDVAKAEHPEIVNEETGDVPLGNNDGWIEKDHIRRAEYYRRKIEFDELLLITEPSVRPDGTQNELAGQQNIVSARSLSKDLLKQLKADPKTRTRRVARHTIEWFKIVGETIVERRVDADALPISYVPIVRVVGEETIIEGKLDRKGHTRAMKDAQRMLNYWVSGGAEQVALQTKIPWTGPVKAFEGYEGIWKTANSANTAYLPWNHVDGDNNPIPAPQRVDPPQMAQAYVQGMQIAEANLMSVSGQHQAQMGEPSNERSGKAIAQRQRQGDNATYHFIDGLGAAIRFTGKILIEWIPKVYDTERVVRIMAEDGTEQDVNIDPKHKEAQAEEKENEQEDKVKVIFNPNVGKYDVQAETGPGYATKRQQAFDAVSTIAAQNQDLMELVGDILFRNADFPGADELAERLKRRVPKNILGEGPGPEVAEMSAEMENLKSLLAQLVQDLAEKDLEIERGKGKGQVDSYKAETDRLKVTGVPQERVAEIMNQLIEEILATQLPLEEQGAEAPIEEMMPQMADNEMLTDEPLAG